VNYAAWREVAEDVFMRSYRNLDLNIVVVRSDGELMLVDSRSSPAEARELVSDLRQFAPAAVRALVNSHAHFDHTFGNQVFGSLSVPIYGHHLVPAHLDDYERPRLAAWRAGSGSEPPRDWADVVITAPSELVNSRQTVALGTRMVELIPLGRGHTDNDLVLRVADSDTWIVGDVIEASGPPMFGSGCFPLELPATLHGLLAEIKPADTIVPGHGPVVDRGFAAAQLRDLSTMAEQLRSIHAAGATVEEALNQDNWPFPVEGLKLAITRAFTSLSTNH
jgi:glyoxylase-like metal-dependent hydrolase (beta-lactamase superfamily II)